jgi:glycerate kinase
VKILVAPDKFKGSISALAAAEAIARGWRAAMPHAEIELAPIADGGEGFAETLCAALGGAWVPQRARDPLGREVAARYVWIERERLAVLDMSEASGLWRLAPAERDPLRATTYGTGQLMRAALERGARRILVGLGGSATTDGGIGMAEALGFRFLTSDGEELEAIPGHLLALTRIVGEGALDFPEIVAACDVQNPLLGERGAARVFGPQKGADARTVATLEEGLRNLADVVASDLGCDHRETPGAGAAGGIGFGLLSFCGATLCSGFDLVADLLRLEARIAACDLIITGEGRLDAQTLEGKGPAGVAALARRHGKPTLAFAGSIADAAAVDTIFTATLPIIDEPVTLDEAMRRGAEFLERTAGRAGRLASVWRGQAGSPLQEI